MGETLRLTRSYDYYDNYNYGGYWDYDSNRTDYNESNSTFNFSYTDFYHGDYPDDYSDQIAASLKGSFFYKIYDFEEPVYLYVWVPLILLTTLTNILVLLVLKHRRMRSATNTILIAIAISDSMTGLVTVPGLIYAFGRRKRNDLDLSQEWCDAFMLIRYFFSRSFHTISIWLTVILGLQRLISVSFPFRAQTIFSMKKTMIAIVAVTVLAPFVHIYHLFDKKSVTGEFASFCEWTFETPCKESCAYLWISVFLMHFLPCGLLVVFTFSMIGFMREASRKMQESKMITNQENIDRRNLESKRITCIVLAVVVVFLIPEVPFGIFLIITAVYRQRGKYIVGKETNREIICAYEILLVLSFQANFWIYVIMNRKFRRGLKRLLDPVLALMNRGFDRFGMEPISRPRLDSTTSGSGGKIPVAASNTIHSRLSTTTNSYRMTGHESRRLSRSNSGPNTAQGREMRTYSFSVNNNQMDIGEIDKNDQELL